MLYRLHVRLESSIVCLSDCVAGTVIVDVSPALTNVHPDGAGGVPVAVRLLVRGAEDCGDFDVVEHIAFVSTVAGERDLTEAAHAAAMLHDVTVFATREARANPLPGVVMISPHAAYSDVAYTTAGGDGCEQPTSTASRNHGAECPSQPPPPPAATATAATAPTRERAATRPQDWVPGGHYEYPFSFQLPPWLPPSYFYEPRNGQPDVAMRYAVYAFVAESEDAPSGAAGTRDGRTKVLVKPGRKNRSRTLRANSNSGDDSTAKSSEKSGSDQDVRRKTSEEDAGATSLCAVHFRLPAEAGKLVGRLPKEQQRKFVVLSAFPRRELLQCVERIAISPPLTHQLVFHLYKYSLGLTGLVKAPFTDVKVRLTYDSSAAVVLCGRPRSVNHVRAALGIENHDCGGLESENGTFQQRVQQQQLRDAPVGLTVTGTVVSASSGADTDAALSSQAGPREVFKASDGAEKQSGRPVASPQVAQLLQTALRGVLRLHVKVRAGAVSINRVKIELIERVRFVGGPDSDKSITYTLASFSYKQKIPANESRKFPVDLKLPTQFRRTSDDDRRLPPPSGVTTSAIHTTTWLQVTLPKLDAVPERLLAEDVVMLAEDVDLTDTVPFLPSSTGATGHSMRPVKVV